MAAPPANSQPGAPQGPNMLLFIVPMFVLMYFVMFRPQQQQRKQQAKMLAALKNGDRVMTAAGIVGTVINIKEKEGIVSLRSADAKFEITKSSITQLLEAATTSES